MKNSIKFLLIIVALITFASCTSEQAVTADTTAEAIWTETEVVTEPEMPDGNINPIFSVPGGITADGTALTISPPDGVPSSVTVHYTTDGDEPNKRSSVYNNALTVPEKGGISVIRAACFDKYGERIGNIVTHSYISQSYTTPYIVSISSDGSYLTGSKGIMDNPTMSGKEWERPAHVEIFTPDGEVIISQDAGLRIFGGSSRVLPQKSFRLIARKGEYWTDGSAEFETDGGYDGSGKFSYPLFSGCFDANGNLVKEFDRLVLRNGGNDSLQHSSADPLDMNMLRDGAANNFAAAVSKNIAVQPSVMVTVLLNGEYYGLLDLKPDIGDDYIADIYDIADHNQIAVMKSELDTSRHCSNHSSGGSCRFCDVWFYYEMDSGEDAEMDSFTALCKRAIEAGDNYNAVYAEVESSIDIDSFMEYAALNLYLCNTDWPHNNVKLWKYTGEPVDGNVYTDGRWRFALRDMDFSFGRYSCLVLPEIYTAADTDTFDRMLGNYYGGYDYKQSSGRYPDSLLLQGLMDFCLKNDDFREKFIEYCEYIVSDESIALLNNIIAESVSETEGEMQNHLTRWKGTYDGSYKYATWESAVEKMKTWVSERTDYFLSYLYNAMENNK